ncbi:putative protein kinase RLK-Pelle-RLCK-VIIa-1 family [Medicago truncatula]|uniref:Protein kinase domain-containing protein n=1 Tax=Medicago truncatula TaxID=3880 RepID=A0A396I7X1_MEDTR|nr:putative protein kinase RLK-Pelle-RLCK-VIIa-1 family [Medicago truncatula]
MSCFCIRPNKSNTQNVTTTIASTASNPENTITTVATASTLPHSFLSKILGKGKLESKVNKKKEDSASTYTEPVKLNIRNEAIQKFCFDELSAATDNFKNIVGQGGFGGVYLGMLQTKQVVAIKRRDSNGVQGTQQFIAEVETLSNVSHKNIVQLIGYCYEKEHKLLVYEYMGLGSLEDNLSGPEYRSTKIFGTIGYFDPDYTKTGILSFKSDIYCFGVVLLELISGTKAFEPNVVLWASPLFEDRFEEIVDPLLKEKYPARDLQKAIAIAASCVQKKVDDRPDISQIVKDLEALNKMKSKVDEEESSGAAESRVGQSSTS